MYRKLETEDRSQMQYGGSKLIADSIADANLIPLSMRANNAKVYCILEETWLIADSTGTWRPYKDAIGYAQGLKGDQGDKGDKGDQGDIGPEGPIGPRGPVGLPGRQGEQGIQGIQGIQGEKGDKGDKGDTGDIGPIGLTGARGERGYAGATQWTVGPDDPDFNTPPDFYINTTSRGVFGPKDEYQPLKAISPILQPPKAYDGGTMSLGMKIKIKQDGTITHLKFYKMRDEATLTRKLKIWDAAGVLIEEIITTNESASGWQKYELTTPLTVVANQVVVVSYGVDGIYGMTNPLPESAYPTFFEFEGSGWNDADMESFPNIDPTPDTPLYYVDFVYDEKPPIVWPLLGYLASAPI